MYSGVSTTRMRSSSSPRSSPRNMSTKRGSVTINWQSVYVMSRANSAPWRVGLMPTMVAPPTAPASSQRHSSGMFSNKNPMWKGPGLFVSMATAPRVAAAFTDSRHVYLSSSKRIASRSDCSRARIIWSTVSYSVRVIEISVFSVVEGETGPRPFHFEYLTRGRQRHERGAKIGPTEADVGGGRVGHRDVVQIGSIGRHDAQAIGNGGDDDGAVRLDGQRIEVAQGVGQTAAAVASLGRRDDAGAREIECPEAARHRFCDVQRRLVGGEAHTVGSPHRPNFAFDLRSVGLRVVDAAFVDRSLLALAQI